jgi:PAS domain S-box-containing protein
MPSQSTIDAITHLAALLARAEPSDVLQQALAFVRELGVVPAADGAGTPFRTLAHGTHSLALVLSTASTLAAEAHAPLADLLQVAFARASEHEELQRVRERMDLLSAASFEGLFFHVGGVIIDANQRLSELIGYTPEEILGDQTLYRCVAPEDVPEVMERLASSYQGAYVVTGVRKDGSRFRAEVQAKQGTLGNRPVRVAAVRDVTERERTQALLRESEERLRSLAHTAFDITVFSRDGLIVDVVGPFTELLGYPRDQVIGRPITDFVAKAAAPQISQRIAERRPGLYETMARATSGEEVPFEIAAVHTTLNGEPVRMAAMRDLREAKRKERERRELELMFERSQRLESLGVLAGGIAHDFNNLLTVVLGNAELLRVRARSDSDRALVQDVIDAAGRAANLTSQMLAYAGRAQLGPRTAIDLGTLLTELRALLDASLSKKARVSVEVADGSIVFGSRATLTQVLMNLLTNASDALADEPGTIYIRTQHVSDPGPRFGRALGARVSRGNWLLLEVRDSGAGMDAATQARIFEPFFTTKATGHGLGLAAAVGIVASHGGAILVESEAGRGSAFSVLFPAYLGAAPVQPRMRARATRDRRSVLVVDDERLVRSNLRSLLEANGYDVREANSGRAALEALARDEPGVVLLDVTMPDLSGVEVLRRIRQSGSQVPVVLSSGYHDAVLEVETETYQGFLLKPYTTAELLEALGS